MNPKGIISIANLAQKVSTKSDHYTKSKTDIFTTSQNYYCIIINYYTRIEDQGPTSNRFN